MHNVLFSTNIGKLKFFFQWCIIPKITGRATTTINCVRIVNFVYTNLHNKVLTVHLWLGQDIYHDDSQSN